MVEAMKGMRANRAEPGLILSFALHVPARQNHAGESSTGPNAATASRARRRTTRSASLPTSDDRASSVMSAVDAKREKARLAMRAKRAKQKELKEAAERKRRGASASASASAGASAAAGEGVGEEGTAARRGERSKGRKVSSERRTMSAKNGRWGDPRC